MVIYYYKVEISDNSGVLGLRNEFNMTEYEVIAQNDSYLVINDFAFTTLSKSDKKSFYDCIGKHRIRLYANDKIWGNAIYYTEYSEKPIKASTIRSRIEKEILKKYSFFLGQIDLSVIKESTLS